MAEEVFKEFIRNNDDPPKIPLKLISKMNILINQFFHLSELNSMKVKFGKFLYA